MSKKSYPFYLVSFSYTMDQEFFGIKEQDNNTQKTYYKDFFWPGERRIGSAASVYSRGERSLYRSVFYWLSKKSCPFFNKFVCKSGQDFLVIQYGLFSCIFFLSFSFLLSLSSSSLSLPPQCLLYPIWMSLNICLCKFRYSHHLAAK